MTERSSKGKGAMEELGAEMYDTFRPYDVSVFRSHTWGALGICISCKSRPAVYMKPGKAGRRRTATWVPFCQKCKERFMEALAANLNQRTPDVCSVNR